MELICIFDAFGPGASVVKSMFVRQGSGETANIAGSRILDVTLLAPCNPVKFGMGLSELSDIDLLLS
jgi:hypothetical protein